jgi:peptidoglycan/LPS O-acetylase OafA/YrhL
LITRLPATSFPDLLAITSIIATGLIISLSSGSIEILIIPTFAVLVYGLRHDESTIAAFFLTKPLALLGKISFSIYLVHYLIVCIIGTVLKVVLQAKSVTMASGTTMFNISPFLGDVLVAVTVICTLIIAKFTYDHIEVKG